MTTIFKFLIIFGTLFVIVFFSGTLLNITPLTLAVVASILVFLSIGYQALEAIKKNRITKRK